MSGIKDSEHIEALRSRLYERGNPPAKRANHHLTHDAASVRRDWNQSANATPTSEAATAEPAPKPTGTQSPPPPTPPSSATSTSARAGSSPRPKKRYRSWLIGGAVAAFVVSLMVSSALLLTGSNTISGANIELSASAPLTVGGGDVLPIQVGIQNNNTVPVETATLIVEYPQGTRADTDEQEPLFTERLVLEEINSGEVVNIPLRALVFGEENEEQTVSVSLEYRVAGSNALFFKEAEPVRYRVGSAPLTIAINAVDNLVSGQETDVVIDITSNSPTPLTNVVLRAEYPLGFDYLDASPNPSAGQNIWQFDVIDPNETVTVTITGVAEGDATEAYALNFSVGTPSSQNIQSLTSIYATAQTEFEIEEAFFAVQLMVAGSQEDTVVVAPDQSHSINIEVQNTLSESVYDAVVELELSGNAISDIINSANGYYDSRRNTITWDISSAPSLEEMEPGDRFRTSLSFTPTTEDLENPEITMQVNVRARRVSDTNAAEEILGNDRSVVRVEAVPVIRSDANYNVGIFENTGPVPPVVEQETTYTISWMLQNGTSNLTDATMTATLPTNVTWLGATDGAGDFGYRSGQRQVVWEVGDVAANQTQIGSFQVSIRPSRTQVRQAPNLVGEQVFTATDTFTNTTVRSTNRAITTELSPEAGYQSGNGNVQSN